MFRAALSPWRTACWAVGAHGLPDPAGAAASRSPHAHTPSWPGTAKVALTTMRPACFASGNDSISGEAPTSAVQMSVRASSGGSAMEPSPDDSSATFARRMTPPWCASAGRYRRREASRRCIRRARARTPAAAAPSTRRAAGTAVRPRLSGNGRDLAKKVVDRADGLDTGEAALPGDFLTSVGGRPVHRLLDAANVVLGSDPGTRVAVEIIRGGVPGIVDVERRRCRCRKRLSETGGRVRSAGRGLNDRFAARPAARARGRRSRARTDSCVARCRSAHPCRPGRMRRRGSCMPRPGL